MENVTWTEFKTKVSTMKAKDLSSTLSFNITADSEPVAMFIIPPTDFSRADIERAIEDVERLVGKRK